MKLVELAKEGSGGNPPPAVPVYVNPEQVVSVEPVAARGTSGKEQTRIVLVHGEVIVLGTVKDIATELAK